MKKLLITVVALCLTSACSIKQRVDPVKVSHNTLICIKENPDVRKGFLAQVKASLNEKRIRYRMVEQLNASDQCEWTMTYTAKWSWDLALYMAYAEIKVFHDGRLDGEAIYDARHGDANMKKFIDSEPKIRELVGQLFQ